MRYNVDSLTIDQLKELIRSGDDSHHNQIRINDKREIYLSPVVGAQCLDGIIGRFETFDAGNRYVGPRAANDDEFINRIYIAIQKWKEHPRTYIDVF